MSPSTFKQPPFFCFPSIQVISFILLFVVCFCFFVFFLFSATISNLTLGSRIVSSTVYPKPNGTLKENVTVVFSCNIVSFSVFNNLDFNSFQTSRSTLPPHKNREHKIIGLFGFYWIWTTTIVTVPGGHSTYEKGWGCLSSRLGV